MEITEAHAQLLQSSQFIIVLKVLTVKLRNHFLPCSPSLAWHSGPPLLKLRITLRTEAELMGSAPCLRSQIQQLINEVSKYNIRNWEKSFLGHWVTQNPYKPQFSLKSTLLFIHTFTPTAFPECSFLSTINHFLIFFFSRFFKESFAVSQPPSWWHFVPAVPAKMSLSWTSTLSNSLFWRTVFCMILVASDDSWFISLGILRLLQTQSKLTVSSSKCPSLLWTLKHCPQGGEGCWNHVSWSIYCFLKSVLWLTKDLWSQRKLEERPLWRQGQ